MSQEELEKKQEDTVSHFESEDFKVAVRKQPYCEIEMDIEILPEGVKKFESSALREAKKEVSVPGFRKGKAPEELVKKNFPKLIQESLKDLLIKNYVPKAFELTNEKPHDPNKIQLRRSGEFKADGSFAFSIDFETIMQIPKVQPQDIKLRKEETSEITEKDVMNELKNLQYEHGTWSPVTDRPIQDGDFIQVRLERIEDNGTLTPIKTGDTLVQVKEEHIFKELYNGLLGKSLNDSFEIEVENPEESEEKQKSRFKATVLSHQFCEPHPLNDELASHQRLESLDQLKSNIESYLKKRREDEVKHSLTEQLDSILFKDYYFDVSRSLVLEMVKVFQEDLKKTGRYDAKNIEMVIRSAIFHSHRSVILDDIFENNNLELSQDDLKGALNAYILDYYRAHGTFPADVMDGSGNIEFIRLTAKRDKAIDFLLSHATYE